ncbi:hypothetical protein J2Z21_001291 [Streptomyces griseochromogenes]|uniref:Uncharacterized protein n=1 Tax=Streptomyces griseochromogenes TaxID=68214 RepID=A0ABS4LLU0_9ACTN|nr:hypothetical protein [Streptomyces griseochromogenes]
MRPPRAVMGGGADQQSDVGSKMRAHPSTGGQAPIVERRSSGRGRRHVVDVSTPCPCAACCRARGREVSPWSCRFNEHVRCGRRAVRRRLRACLRRGGCRRGR